MQKYYGVRIFSVAVSIGKVELGVSFELSFVCTYRTMLEGQLRSLRREVPRDRGLVVLIHGLLVNLDHL